MVRNNGHGKPASDGEHITYDDLGAFLSDPRLKEMQEKASLGFADSRFMFTLSGVTRAVETFADLISDLSPRDLENWDNFVKHHSRPYTAVFREIRKLAAKKKK